MIKVITMGIQKGTFVDTVVLTATVFAALIASVTNIIISVINNYRIKKIEKNKLMNDINKYRYSRLYELVLNWHQYDSEYQGDTAEKTAYQRMRNLFIDDRGRYELAKPLLDKCYIEELESKRSEGDNCLNRLIENENSDGTHSDKFCAIRSEYFNIGVEFSKMLKEAINQQLETLLNDQ